RVLPRAGFPALKDMSKSVARCKAGAWRLRGTNRDVIDVSRRERAVLLELTSFADFVTELSE
ncbi:MAG: hypothetical protein ABJ354_17055, partial [Nitratireductor sp.]